MDRGSPIKQVMYARSASFLTTLPSPPMMWALFDNSHPSLIGYLAPCFSKQYQLQTLIRVKIQTASCYISFSPHPAGMPRRLDRKMFFIIANQTYLVKIPTVNRFLFDVWVILLHSLVWAGAALCWLESNSLD
ncbi:uncharacterized protein RHIMIDRAFT_265741 [Rhizopus microsporus ATCC 52813]|uniref:Uncharacterized protein n=1 Tax=Rhizopus microsporus ATCC 52813 TaxID=1340429 RepID=A0A2G4T5N3_RHIZD|nr:uncharacterized protein RHIMIDRAFT_265741 [Rhizopus microsporus ATCC 52813]PHZ16325.1 hypothetical protein RHIMIDRAFT_265741 [Rhizopus microsporus ATCC 52813]